MTLVIYKPTRNAPPKPTYYYYARPMRDYADQVLIMLETFR